MENDVLIKIIQMEWEIQAKIETAGRYEMNDRRREWEASCRLKRFKEKGLSLCIIS